MALVKCKECGEQVSTKAEACPKCGAKMPKRSSLGAWLVLVIILFVVYAANQSPSSNRKSSSNSSSSSNVSSTSTTRSIPKPIWTATTSTDEMTGKKTAYAFSPTVASKRKMGFPYRDVAAWLGVGCDGKSEWAYIGFNSAPNLADTETEDGYNRINTRIKWNNHLEKVTLTQDWGASFIHFVSDKSAITKIITSNAALLELKWHGEQPTYFEFSLNGSSAALKRMRGMCAKK